MKIMPNFATTSVKPFEKPPINSLYIRWSSYRVTSARPFPVIGFFFMFKILNKSQKYFIQKQEELGNLKKDANN